jgi:hypothetical protein
MNDYPEIETHLAMPQRLKDFLACYSTIQGLVLYTICQTKSLVSKNNLYVVLCQRLVVNSFKNNEKNI